MVVLPCDSYQPMTSVVVLPCDSYQPMTGVVVLPCESYQPIGLYRDVWIAAIASSRTRLATLSGVMCNTSQCELRSLRVNSGMLNVIRIVTYWIAMDCNGVFAIKAYAKWGCVTM